MTVMREKKRRVPFHAEDQRRGQARPERPSRRRDTENCKGEVVHPIEWIVISGSNGAGARFLYQNCSNGMGSVVIDGLRDFTFVEIQERLQDAFSSAIQLNATVTISAIR